MGQPRAIRVADGVTFTPARPSPIARRASRPRQRAVSLGAVAPPETYTPDQYDELVRREALFAALAGVVFDHGIVAELATSPSEAVGLLLAAGSDPVLVLERLLPRMARPELVDALRWHLGWTNRELSAALRAAGWAFPRIASTLGLEGGR